MVLVGLSFLQKEKGPGGNGYWEDKHPKVCGFNTEVLIVTIEVIQKLYIIWENQELNNVTNV